MASLLKVDNLDATNIQERTSLSANVAAAATSLLVGSSSNITVNNYALIGGPPLENSELKLITGVSDTALTVPALARAHQRFDTVTVLKANKIKIYRAENVDGTVPDDADFAVLTTVDIDPDQLQTTYVDPSGGTGYWYKATYYNSQTTAESTFADAQASRGGGYNQYASTDEVRRVAGLQDAESITDSFVEQKREAAQDEVDGTLDAAYDVPFDDPPEIIREVTRQLAAGFLLQSEYGAMSDDVSKQGGRLVKQARELLDRIASRKVVLYESDGDSLLGGTGVNGWPDDSTAESSEEDAGEDRVFRISHRF